MKKNYPVAYKKSHLIVGQKVRVAILGHQYNMRGVITAIDDRFRNPYEVKLVLDDMGKPIKQSGHFKAIELAITRYKEPL